MGGNRTGDGYAQVATLAVVLTLLLTVTAERAASQQTFSPTAPAQPSITYGPWSEPIRISQLGDQSRVTPPPANTEAIQPIVPGQAATVGQPPVERRVPFQQRLPDELISSPPSQATKEQFDRFIPKVVDPANTLNLLVGHPRILTFADWAVQPQLRLYLPDEGIARWDIISDTEVALVGTAPGTTVLTLWFNDPTAENGKRVLSYRLRVNSK